MHVIEPRIRKKNHRSSKIIIPLIIVVALVGCAATIRAYKAKQNVLGSHNISSTSSTSTGSFKFLSGYDIQKIYATTPLPNLTQVIDAPSITNNNEVDARIRKIAESRGYKLQDVPTESVVTVEDTNIVHNRLQPLALAGWQKLRAKAKEDNIPLLFISGFISISDQRQLYLQELNNRVDVSKIESGQADSALIGTVQQVAPPGYSRHQTGYAIDLACSDGSGRTFELSSCGKWLLANNYSNARSTGFIPSYADGVGVPNTNTSLAEYVWVGSNQLF